MEMRSDVIYLLGCGPGAEDLVTPRVHQFASLADILIGCPRALALFPNVRAQRIVHEQNLPSLLDLLPTLLEAKQRTAWLCTGDSAVYSVAHSVRKAIGHQHCIMEPGISSVQLACAKLAVHMPEVHIASAHGREWRFNPAMHTSHLCILSGTLSNLQNLLACAYYLEPSHELFVLADLSLASEIVCPIGPLEISEWISHPRVLFFWRKYE